MFNHHSSSSNTWVFEHDLAERALYAVFSVLWVLSSHDCTCVCAQGVVSYVVIQLGRMIAWGLICVGFSQISNVKF